MKATSIPSEHPAAAVLVLNACCVEVQTCVAPLNCTVNLAVYAVPGVNPVSVLDSLVVGLVTWAVATTTFAPSIISIV